MLSSGRGSLWAIDRATGSVLWATMTGGRGIAGNDLALRGGLGILASSDAGGRNSAVVGIDLLTGEMRWTLPLPGYAHSGATMAGGLALAANATPDQPYAPAAEIRALDPETGRIVWDVPAASIWAGVVAAQDDTAYVIARWSDADPEELLALDLETGALIWERTIAGSGDVVGLQDGVLYVTGDRDIQAVSDLHVYVGDDELSALDAETGAVLWTRPATVS
jgi:outer membrane protein assembly factor BamB